MTEQEMLEQILDEEGTKVATPGQSGKPKTWAEKMVSLKL